MARVIVKIAGGCVQEVIHNVEGLEVVILDADLDGADESDLIEYEGKKYYEYCGGYDEFSSERVEFIR